MDISGLPADLTAERYNATHMLSQLDTDREELLRANPGFAMFLGAGGGQG